MIIPTAETATRIMTLVLRPSSLAGAAVVVEAGSASSGRGSSSASGITVGFAPAAASLFAVDPGFETSH